GREEPGRYSVVARIFRRRTCPNGYGAEQRSNRAEFPYVVPGDVIQLPESWRRPGPGAGHVRKREQTRDPGARPRCDRLSRPTRWITSATATYERTARRRSRVGPNRCPRLRFRR